MTKDQIKVIVPGLQLLYVCVVLRSWMDGRTDEWMMTSWETDVHEKSGGFVELLGGFACCLSFFSASHFTCKPAPETEPHSDWTCSSVCASTRHMAVTTSKYVRKPACLNDKKWRNVVIFKFMSVVFSYPVRCMLNWRVKQQASKQSSQRMFDKDFKQELQTFVEARRWWSLNMFSAH